MPTRSGQCTRSKMSHCVSIRPGVVRRLAADRLVGPERRLDGSRGKVRGRPRRWPGDPGCRRFHVYAGSECGLGERCHGQRTAALPGRSAVGRRRLGEDRRFPAGQCRDRLPTRRSGAAAGRLQPVRFVPVVHPIHKTSATRYRGQEIKYPASEDFRLEDSSRHFRNKCFDDPLNPSYLCLRRNGMLPLSREGHLLPSVPYSRLLYRILPNARLWDSCGRGDPQDSGRPSSAHGSCRLDEPSDVWQRSATQRRFGGALFARFLD